MVASEDLFTSVLGKKVRTYFNMLDSYYRKGLVIIFISVILLERNDKGEEFFTIIAIIIGALDLCLDYNSSGLKKLPMNPWSTGDTDDEDEKVPKKKSKIDDSVLSSDLDSSDEDQDSAVDLEKNKESKRARKLNK